MPQKSRGERKFRSSRAAHLIPCTCTRKMSGKSDRMSWWKPSWESDSHPPRNRRPTLKTADAFQTIPFSHLRLRNWYSKRGGFARMLSEALHLLSPRGGSRLSEAPRYWRLGFWSLIATQFQGAFNDNALKFLIIYLIIGTNLSSDKAEAEVLLVGVLFAAPFILFSMTGGF